jgi:hypothetical protein
VSVASWVSKSWLGSRPMESKFPAISRLAPGSWLETRLGSHGSWKMAEGVYRDRALDLDPVAGICSSWDRYRGPYDEIRRTAAQLLGI